MRKGQVTIFIILGVLLVLALFLLFLFRDSGQSFETVEDVPAALLPLKEFVDGCIEKVTVEALVLAGQHGGYVNPLRHGIAAGPDPTMSGAVEMLPGYFIPYWWYLKSGNECRDCEFSRNLIPRLHRDGQGESVEEQLDQYVQTNLDSCMHRFEGMELETGEAEANTKLGSVATVRLKYPITAMVEGREHRIEDFLVSIPVDVESIYKAALNLTEVQAEERFLEKNTLDLINVHAGIDKSRLPPMAASDFGGTPVVWVVSEVEANVKDLLGAYVPVLRLGSSLNAPRYQFPKNFPYSALVKTVSQAVLDHMTLSLFGFEGYKVNFFYSTDWHLYFDINNRGGLIQPESGMSNIIPGADFGLQRYSGVYDLSYPVLVEIRDDAALNGRGYSWKFALESNIRRNKALPAEFTPFESSAPGEGSLLCNSRNSGNVTVKVVSAGGPVAGAEVLFKSFDSCSIGETNEDGVFVGQFPVGIGLVEIVHPEYLAVQRHLKTYIDAENTIAVELQPMKDVAVVGRKAVSSFVAGEWSAYSEIAPLQVNETLFVSLIRRKEQGMDGYATAVVLKGPSENVVRLAPGKYVLRVVLVSEEKVEYRPKTTCIVVGEVFGGTELCTTFPEKTELVPVPSLSYEMDWEYEGESELAIVGAFMDVRNGGGDVRQDVAYAARINDHVIQQRKVFEP